jgi:hypothetical protein
MSARSSGSDAAVATPGTSTRLRVTRAKEYRRRTRRGDSRARGPRTTASAQPRGTGQPRRRSSA